LIPGSVSVFSETPAGAICLVSIMLVPLAMAGLALISCGLGRSRSATHVILASLCAVSVSAIVYVVCGFSWDGFAGGPAHVWLLRGKPWNWIAAQPFFLRGIELDGSPASLAALLQMFGAGLAAIIPLSATMDRWRLSAICASTALLAGCTYPIFAHWVWGGGWLAQLGENYGLGRGFVDSGGASTIQVVGGLTALSMVWILGPRLDKYSDEGMPTAIPGHSPVYVVFGCFLAWLGWLGLNSAGAILFSHALPGRVVLIAVNTTLSTASAGLMALVITGLRFGRPDASITANGWVGGLVASSAAPAFVNPAASLIIGIIAGILVTYAVDWFEMWLKIDDPGGAIPVHALAGIWGLLAVGLFARLPGQNPASGQWLAQLIGIATLLGFVLPLTYSLNWLLDRVYPQRVEPDGERQGMDLHELGAGAYPEFVVHTDEFIQR
jgi:ammonium transporter, Amt family